MKRLGAILLALCLLTVSGALAELSPVARSGGLAAYTDGQGQIFIPGRKDAVNDMSADAIISIDNYRLAYLTASEDGGTSDLRFIDLETMEDTLAAEGVYTACLLGEGLYFVPAADRTQLNCLDTADMTVDAVHTANEAIDRLYASSEGLAFELVDQAGAFLYDPATDAVVPYAGDIPVRGVLTDSFEAYIDDEDTLWLKDADAFGAAEIATDVAAFTVLDDVLYYLTDDGDAQSLLRYDPSIRMSGEVAGGLEGLTDQLTATGSRICVLTTGGEIYGYDPYGSGQGTLLGRFDDLSGYDLPEGTTATGLRIEGLPGFLNVYAEVEEEEALPDFTFIEFETDADAAETRLFLLDSIDIEGEGTSWDVMEPAAQYATLYRGCRGEAVRAIQQPLYDLGYYNYYVDGIFGPRTQWAIRLLQADLGLPDNGIADAALQRTILSGTLSAYDPCIPLPRGSRGLRVQIMQQRLRDLGYLADAADRIYGGRTQKAVQLFQQENGIAVSNRATRVTLTRLFSGAALPCSSYIDLYPGDTGYRVRALNERLRELFYLESSIGSVYTAQTSSAVRVFQRTAGLPETGEATVRVQQLLFADDAPEVPGYVLLCRGDANARVTRLQNRLKELGYFTGKATGYYGRATQAAVALFQQKVGLRITGTATVRTQQLLFDDDAPAYVKPTWISEPIITINDYEYFDEGVYYITDDSGSNGYITFDWYAEGDVANYGVVIEDSKGNICLDRETLLERTGVSVSTLKYGRVYTLTVTAFPEDGDDDHITGASLRFSRVKPEPESPKVGKIGNPSLSVKTVARVENGVNYVMPGKVTLKWHADGDVDHYKVSVVDESDGALLEIGSTTGESTKLNTDQLVQGEVYTLYVYAIPTNGTMENARMRSLRFALPVVELPEPEPEPEPEPVAPPKSGPLSIPEITLSTIEREENGVTYLTGDTITISWTANGSVEKYSIELLDDAGTPITSGVTSDTSLSMNRTNLKTDTVYTVKVTAVPENGTAEDGTYNTARFALYTPDAGQEPEVYDDTFVKDEDALEEEEDAAETPEAPKAAAPTEGEDAEAPVEGADAEVPGESEEAQVPEGGTEAIGAPELTFSPAVTGGDGIAYVSGDVITLSWETEGDVQAYEVKILDGSGTQRASTTTDSTALNIRSSNLAPDDVYTLVVTAIPADSAMEPTSDSARFALYVEAEQPEEAPADEPVEEPAGEAHEAPADEAAEEPAEEAYEEPMDEAAEEPAGEAYEAPADEAVEEPAEEAYEEPMDEAAEEPAGEAYEAPADEAVEAPEEAYQEAPSYAPVSAPEIHFDPVADYDGDIALINGDLCSISWIAGGDIQSFDVSITDASGSVMASTNTANTALSFRTSGMTPGMTYTLNVTANPMDGAAPSAGASARFALYAEPAQEEPEETYQEPEQSYEEPAETYEEPEETYQEPDQTYQEPEETYQEPEETYQEPAETYEEPEETYQEPAETYQEPEETYQEPAETYQEPEETYQEPEETYQEPAETYQEPEETYQEPEQSYEEPEETYEEPAYAPVEAPEISIDPVDDTIDDVCYVSGDKLSLSWQAEGDVESYAVRILDPDGETIASTETQSASLVLPTDDIVPGKVYTLSVTAVPMGSGYDSASASLRFAVRAEAASEPGADEGESEEYDGDAYDEEYD